jgi:hypothetical protein
MLLTLTRMPNANADEYYDIFHTLKVFHLFFDLKTRLDHRSAFAKETTCVMPVLRLPELHV